MTVESPGPRMLLAGILRLSLVALAGCVEPAAAVQPIPFNHRIHEENDLECGDCHEGVDRGGPAGLPGVEVCMDCHDADITENPAALPSIDRIRRHAAAGTPIPWVRLYALPGHVFFSHRLHVGPGELSCTPCHGDIGKSTAPARRAIAETLDMDGCIACHATRGVDADCARCHR